jgi:glycosyl transferase family 87
VRDFGIYRQIPAVLRPLPSRAPPVFDNRLVRLSGLVLAAGYALIFARLWILGGTLFGYRNLPQYDFSFFWAAGRLALAGKAVAAYDWKTLDDLMSTALGRSEWYAGPFFYPPIYLLLLAPFALFPYAVAAALWLAFTLAAYLAGIGRILKGWTAIIAALAAPTVLFNLLIGQNGLLAAGLFGGALAILDEHPVGAGVLIGCLACKPQFGLIFPVLLAVTGRWRSFAAAAATVLALAAIAAAAFGWSIFGAFAGNMPIASDAFFRHGEHALDWDHLASVYGTMRLLGAGAATAWSVHIALALAAIAATCWIALRRPSIPLVGASAALAAVIITPYSGLNDLAILTVAMAFLVEDGLERGFSRWDMPVLGVAFLAPLLVFVALGPPGAAGPIMCGLLAALVGARLPLGRRRL